MNDFTDKVSDGINDLENKFHEEKGKMQQRMSDDDDGSDSDEGVMGDDSQGLGDEDMLVEEDEDEGLL